MDNMFISTFDYDISYISFSFKSKNNRHSYLQNVVAIRMTILISINKTCQERSSDPKFRCW